MENPKIMKIIKHLVLKVFGPKPLFFPESARNIVYEKKCFRSNHLFGQNMLEFGNLRIWDVGELGDFGIRLLGNL